MSLKILHVLLIIFQATVCELETKKIIELLESGNTIENYDTVKARIGSFIDTKEIKIHNNIELGKELKVLNDEYPQITYLYQIGKSIRGTFLTVLAIGKFARQNTPGIPEFKYIANIHGNEISGRELLLCLAHVLLENYGKNELITSLVNKTRIHLLPTMNPDGFEDATPGIHGWIQGRTNAAGIDLNRNFPQRLGPNSVRNMQPETEAIIRWTKAIPFVLSANLHDGSTVVNFPYDDGRIEGVEAKTGDHELFVQLAYSYARAHKFMWKKGPRCIGRFEDDELDEGITNGNKWYSVSGGMQDWNYVFADCFELTIEMSCEKYPNSKELKQLWDEHKFALISFIEKIHKSISGFVLDGSSGIGIPNVLIFIDKNSKVISSNAHGDFWRIVIPGTYNVTFQHSLYESVAKTVHITSEVPYKVFNVTLRRKSRFWNFDYDKR
ncbi:unnamed protein product [Thelazia callipaeda]|uniref:Peptidase_M14 domain-containing protein n=1 Tax=Thelazia callipaeda TaxID=103827 RepID=A0A0N5DC44_THECL|nr:unnamed protein product [Thelazia callipaeda]